MTHSTRDPKDAAFAEVLVQESPDALLAVSPRGEILFWNRGAQTIFGYTAEEAVGRTVDDLLVADDDRGEAQAMIDRALAAGSVVFEATRRTKGGSFVHVDVSIRAVRDEAGAVR